MEKVFIFLNKKDNETAEQFKASYLGAHKDKVLAFGVHKYLANVLEQPSDELVKAGWGVYSADNNVFEAFDEVWTDDVDGLIKLYDDENLICVYRVDDTVVRSCVVDTPEGEPTFWLKRITLISRREGMSRQTSLSTGRLFTVRWPQNISSAPVSMCRTMSSKSPSAARSSGTV